MFLFFSKVHLFIFFFFLFIYCFSNIDLIVQLSFSFIIITNALAVKKIMILIYCIFTIKIHMLYFFKNK
jgi:hypothetical protein